jgi:NAD(P)-dependent dehydrogenase (short-subunit alcohol dehydrogenase family)
MRSNVIITGAASGIGCATARLFARAAGGSGWSTGTRLASPGSRAELGERRGDLPVMSPTPRALGAAFQSFARRATGGSTC